MRKNSGLTPEMKVRLREMAAKGEDIHYEMGMNDAMEEIKAGYSKMDDYWLDCKLLPPSWLDGYIEVWGRFQKLKGDLA